MFNKLKFKMYYYILYLNDNDYDIILDVYYNVIKLIKIICIFIVQYKYKKNCK